MEMCSWEALGGSAKKDKVRSLFFCSLIQDDEMLINVFASETRQGNSHKKLWA